MEIGKRYFFKTLSHYYLGELVHQTAVHAVIKDASEVYETGALAEFFGKGKVKICERVPDGWMVPLSGTCIGPWLHDLPKEAILSNQ